MPSTDEEKRRPKSHEQRQCTSLSSEISKRNFLSRNPSFSCAVLSALGNNAELLYHNHTGDSTFRYSYPLIQYKRIQKKAAIFCIGEGVDAIGQFLSAQKFDIHLGERPIQLAIETVYPKRNLVQTWDSTFRYHLRNWLALNSENYQKYKELDEITARISFLENILIGNLLSFAKGMKIEIKNQIVCKLLSMDEPRLTTVKGVRMMTFDVEFKSNLSLPDYMGLGKHVSIGYGTVVRAYNTENNHKE